MAMTNAQKVRRAEKRKQERAAMVTAKAEPCEPVCVECGALATDCVPWSEVYRPRPDRPDLMEKMFWRCACGAYVGCHQGTRIPLGRPAGPVTQAARKAAHAAFDRLWLAKAEREEISRNEARGKGYAWLAAQLGIEPRACHIGWMDAATARRVAVLCAPSARRAA